MKNCFVIIVMYILIAVPVSLWGKTLTVGVSTGYPPYYYKKDGEFTGLCVEIVNLVAGKLGVTIKYEEFPWKRLLVSAKAGEVDAIMPLFKTPKRESYLIFDNLELAFESNSFFTDIDTSVSYTGNLEQLSNYRIGVVTGYSYGELFDSFDFNKKLNTLDDAHLVEMFKYNRFKVGVGNRFVVHYYAGIAGVADRLKFIEPELTREILYLGFAKRGGRLDLVEEFASTLQAFKRTEEYRALESKYGIVDPTEM